MKKLTAGIFTVLLGLVSINSAEAAVASKDYVDAKVKSVGGDVGTLTQTVTDLTQTVADNKTAAENAVNTEKAAREAADSALGTRVTTAEGKITTLQGDKTVEGSVAKSIADAIAGEDLANKFNAKQDKSAMTTTVSESSTDAFYPTAKAVYDYVASVEKTLNDGTSGVQGEVAQLRSDLTGLEQESEAADAALTKAVGDEETARKNADTALQEALNSTNGVVSAMETAYKAADEALDKAYKAADQALKTDLEAQIAGAAGDASKVAADLAEYETKTDKAIADETAARVQGDADTLAAAKTDAANKADAALAAAKEDATSKANAAQAAAEETAAADATSKATQALADAKTYADGKASAAQAAAEATAAADAKSKADKALEDAKAYADQKGTALDTALKQYADQAESDAIATAGTNADTKISNLNLNELSRVPADCADAKNYCVLTSDGSKYLWEVITRADDETQPQGAEIPSVK